MHKRLLILPLLFWATMLAAQDLAYRMAANRIAIDPAENSTLSLAIDNISFFKDNEFEGEQAKGYSLPGLWLEPRIVYQPLDNIRLEAGIHATIFHGANKYPCYAYHDIGAWKGNQYQHGAHVLPFFRAQAALGNFTIVLGDIYGGANHQVMEVLMNPEVNLTQDPEKGFQLLWQRRHYQMDAWLNWQSYIFNGDTHQEAFTIGLHQNICLNAPEANVHWYMPIDILAQHRGGEQDITDTGVQTLTNGGVALGMKWNAERHVLRSFTCEAAFLTCWQQSGKLWPYDFGIASSYSLAAEFIHDIRVFGGMFMAHKFVSLYGAPFYSTLSLKHEGARFKYIVTPHVGIEWSHTFANDYTIGAKLDAYPLYAGRLSNPNGETQSATYSTNFSFGIYFSCHPSFLLKRFK